MHGLWGGRVATMEPKQAGQCLVLFRLTGGPGTRPLWPRARIIASMLPLWKTYRGESDKAALIPKVEDTGSVQQPLGGAA